MLLERDIHLQNFLFQQREKEMAKLLQLCTVSLPKPS